MQPLSEGKGIFTFFVSILSARSVIVVFIIEGPFLLNLELYQLILSYLMLAFQSSNFMCIVEILVRKAVEVDGGQLKHNGTFVISEYGSIET